MKELIFGMVSSIVDEPDKVVISEIQGQHIIIYEVTVAKQDIGKVLGKQGKNINALRILIMSIASRLGKKISIEVLDVEEGPL